MTDITSGLQNIPKINPCDFTSIPDTGSSIMNIPNTNNIVNNKYFSQQRIHSQTTTTEDRDPDPSQSKDHPLTNFPNGEKFNPPSIFSDGESFSSHPQTNFPHGEEFNPPSILSDGESSSSNNHKYLNDSVETHPSTDLMQKKHQIYNPSIKPIAAMSSCETPTHLNELDDQMEAIAKETRELQRKVNNKLLNRLEELKNNFPNEEEFNPPSILSHREF